MTCWLGVDTGGTFTDFVVLGDNSQRIHKVLSTPGAPEQAIFRGIEELGLSAALAAGELVIVHGTTVATNAALEGKGARTLMITNEGLEDVLLIGRQTRQALYDLTPTAVPEPLQRQHILGVPSRLDARGKEIRPLDPQAVAELVARVQALKPEAVAISLLFSYLNPAHEEALEDALRAALADSDVFICRSAEVLPLTGEYERGLATWLNAWLGPGVADYLDRLGKGAAPSRVSIMQSSGGTLSLDAAARRAVNLLLSGPAGGLNAARAIGEQLNMPRLMTFDMGGTSTDVALLDHGFRLTLEGRIGHWPVAVPMVDMHTIGAGGGSLAYVDAAGMLHVGPESAGADPGPACYGRGGTRVTVTDANLVLGHLPASQTLGGHMALDRAAACAALDTLARALDCSAEEAARGVLALANEHMAQALRVISIQKGYDPADFVLMSFGGAGGLHVCALADMLGMRQALVPRNSGVLSAQGLVRSPRQRELIRALPADANPEVVDALARTLQEYGHAALTAEGVREADLATHVSVDLCYRGQSFPLTVPWEGDPEAAEATFHQLHEARYGHRLTLPVAWINVRVQVTSREPLPSLPPPDATPPGEPGTTEVAGPGATPVWPRDALPPPGHPLYPLSGPLIITEAVATTWVAPGWQLNCLDSGDLLLQRL
ncbi:hydantoinase/oxoprolinase family protein [Alcanivorax sp. JB21]|uniref:hydantoinase/oxoprolinase family protein n=1 Tax=Alcanivorax limicola TaxID=2874102 RepID=UPI001CBE6BE5|nr:hydantoinase/oxoprolinase family protein [Alcanivorax limicola]MBZ2189087.1 hydantoinase/oxoprolinase family protein [Alcanivorax limicola]